MYGEKDNMAIIVPCYGIHFESDTKVGWLVQGRNAQNAIGLRRPCPFRVQLPSGRRHCNFQIPQSAPTPNDYHWGWFAELVDSDPLVRSVLPLPKVDPGVYYISSADNPVRLNWVMSILARLSSPINSVMSDAHYTFPNAKNLAERIGETNIQTHFVYGLEAKHSSELSKFATAVSHGPGKVVLSGAPDVVVPQTAKRIETSLMNEAIDINDLNQLPWEILGATVTRFYLRHEWDFHNVKDMLKVRHGYSSQRVPRGRPPVPSR